VADIQADAPLVAPGQERRFDLRCQMCSRLAGQIVDRVFVHHPDCPSTPLFAGSLPRCCACGGSLYCEPTDSPMSSAADRAATLRYRPSTR
jgi:hypothetical protein